LGDQPRHVHSGAPPPASGRSGAAGEHTKHTEHTEHTEHAEHTEELSDDDLSVFLELSSELFGVFDPRGGLVWCNPSVASVLGYRPDELSRVDLAGLVHPDDLGQPTDDLEDFPRDGALRTLEVRCRTKDGAWRWLEWTGSWERSSGLLYGAGRDVTDSRRSREALAENERLMQAILDHSQAVVYVKDLGGRYVLVNDAFLRLTGRGRDEVVGRGAEEVWAPRPAPGLDAERTVAAEGRVVTADLVVDVGGAEHTFMTSYFPVFDARRTLVGTAAIATDVTERAEIQRRLLERQRLLDTIVNACPDIVTILDRQGKVKAVSQASARILGDDLGEPGHEALEALVHPDDVPNVRRCYGELLRGRARQLEIRYRVRHRDGHFVTLDTRGQALVGEDGEVEGVVAISRDITADLAFEEELHAAVEEAERASTAKSAFLSRMSHELRTPLNSVLGFAQLLAMDELDGQQEEAVGHILRAGQHLLDLIDEVLDVASIESGRLEISLEPVDVADVVGDAIDLSGPLAEARNVALEVDLQRCPPSTCVRADRQRLLQVLLNLLSNGVKYNRAEGRVCVSVEVAGAEAHIAVSDTGPGIAREDVDRVFKPFDRLGAERSGVEGTGVGLTLSKHLVEQMGGTITLSSEPTSGATPGATPGATSGATSGAISEPTPGATFTVSLPLASSPRAPRPGSAPVTGASVAGGGMRVLHIEDNLANLELVEQIVSRAGPVELRAAMYGSLGLELAREHRPDLILLDLHLPDMGGIEVLEQLRHDPELAHVPVVVVSADATPSQMRRLRAQGVLAYLTKPIDVGELLQVVGSVGAGSRR
jgi:PAS domain S-box-containing protein